MNKFRARQLDASRPIAIWIQPDQTELTEQNNVTNRTVPQLPTGMEKDEETEHHLQQAIYHQRVIPVPEVFDTTQDEDSKKFYDKVYPPNFKIPRQFVHMHPFAAEQEIVDYDLDSEDEQWLESKGSLLPLDDNQFEEIIDRLEKASGVTAVTLQEAKVFLKEDDDLITVVYDYWLNKRLTVQHALVATVRSEKCTGHSPTDPYVAFRKRTEKMQTRKNRKNDEASYEKMLKLKRDFSRTMELFDLVERREELKLRRIQANRDIYEKRYKLEDFSGSIINEMASLRARFVPYSRSYDSLQNHQILDGWHKPQSHEIRKKDEKRERRPYKKRRVGHSNSNAFSNHNVDSFNLSSAYSQDGPPSVTGSEDDLVSHSDMEDDANMDGQFTFKRKAYVTYHAPREHSANVEKDPFYKYGTPKRPENIYCLTSINRSNPRFIGRARRRVGRGGRIWLDRTCLPTDRFVDIKDKTVYNTPSEYLSEEVKHWPHFKPPVTEYTDEITSDPVSIQTSYLMTAEVVEGEMAGSLSQIEVTSSGEPNLIPIDHSCISSKFVTYEPEVSYDGLLSSSFSYVNNSLVTVKKECDVLSMPTVKLENHSSPVQKLDSKENALCTPGSQKKFHSWGEAIISNGPTIKTEPVPSILSSETNA